MSTNPHWGFWTMLWSLICYGLWHVPYAASMYLRLRWALRNPVSNWLLSWAGIYGYRDQNIAWWKQ